MSDITNPIAIKFSNEVIRPLAEEMKLLKVRADQAMTDWYAGINTLFPNDSSPVQDGREAEGISRLTGADVNNLMGQVGVYKSQLEQPGVPQVIAKPCVRTF